MDTVIYTKQCPYCPYNMTSRESQEDLDALDLNHLKAKHPEKYNGEDDYVPGDFGDA